MASSSGPTLAHTRVASIRSAPNQGHSSQAVPHTPPRTITSTYGSPSTIRADDDIIIIELGSRFVRVGFAGDSGPKAVLSCGPEQRRREGDFRVWEQSDGHKSSSDWVEDYQIWRHDVRDFDMGLFEDKLERLLREAFTKYLLVDSRPRRAGLVLDSAMPLPILSTILDLLFSKFQMPIISLTSAPTMTAVAAGTRSALVVDLGWSETVVTSIYEYREVRCTRSVRGAKRILDELYKNLVSVLKNGETSEAEETKRTISFEECEDILCRLMWCRSSTFKSSQRQSAQLETVEEQDESDADAPQVPSPAAPANIPMHVDGVQKTIQVPFEKLADACDDAFFDPAASPGAFDDHELPVHLLVYQHLLQLPMDVRATCMSRIMFNGGCSRILGIKERIVDEVTSMVERRGWAPVSGKGVEQLRSNPHLQRKSNSPPATEGESLAVPEATEETDGLSPAAHAEPEPDPIEAKVMRNRPAPKTTQGELRAVHSLGPWSGASLLSQLKIPAMATVDRELWLQQGAAGASRPSDVDAKAQQRQSIGAGGLIRGSGGHHTNWTLGLWGSL